MKNEPTFPAPNFAANTMHEGMTLRDYFAAKAIGGWILVGKRAYPEYDAEDAYRLADAMLKARETA